MADLFGALEFPVAPDGSGSVTDPTLDKLAAFLKAVLNADLGAAWALVSPNKAFVEQAFPKDPQEGSFNERDLPALFVWRGSSTGDRITDDWNEDVTDVQVLWVPQTAEQARRATRPQAINGFQKAIRHALMRSRHPAWVDPGDTLVDAGVLGSVLNARCKFFRWPVVMSVKPDPLTIQKDAESKAARYPGVRAVIRIYEKTYSDPALRGSPASLESTVTQGGGAFVLEDEFPPDP